MHNTDENSILLACSQRIKCPHWNVQFHVTVGAVEPPCVKKHHDNERFGRNAQLC